MQTTTHQTTPATGIHDNHLYGKVGDYLREKIQPDAELSFVSAYFTIFAHDALRPQLGAIRNLRFLFGEPRFIATIDPEKNDPKTFQIEDNNLALAKRLTQRAVAKACADWLRRDTVEIRSIAQSNLLHGKLYHIQNGPVADALLGSSNFTLSGLGLGNTPNIELNMEVDSKRDLAALRDWFEKLWRDTALTRDVKAEVLAYLAKLYSDYSPEFVYFKTLFHVFENFLNSDAANDFQIGKTSLLESGIWNTLFGFQKDGVKGIISKINTHNGCILADSVGLGKTFEALAVIKYFELRNQNVLVLCPKKLHENWAVYRRNDKLNPFLKDRFRFDVLSHTDLSRESGMSAIGLNLETLNWENYDLVVIDESHNFRNNSAGRRDEDGNIPRKSRYARLLEDILTAGVKSKVLLLSATPVNNSLKDLRNQLYLLSEGDDSAFAQSIGIPNFSQTLKVAQQQFTLWAKRPDNARKTRDLLSTLDSGFFKLLDNLTIARSRNHVKRYYKEAIEKIGGFPKREKPLSVYPDIDTQKKFMSYEQLDASISKYKLSLYNPFAFVRPEFHELYEKTTGGGAFTQAGREHFLIGMMKVGFLKRLESSVRAFKLTMERTDKKITELEDKIKDYQRRDRLAKTPPGELDLEVDEELPLEYADDEEVHRDEIGARLKYQLEHLDLDAWLLALAADRAEIQKLKNDANSITPERDAKLADLKKHLAQKLAKPTKNKEGKKNKKVLVFTAYADTAAYLYENLHDWALTEHNAHIALVTGGGTNKTTLGGTDFDDILTNFSPRSKHRAQLPNFPQDEEIYILIATDCISEGQNLQDCDLLINYDIHWNPVRIIQRFGRIDRIGSINSSVTLVNFWPTPNLDHYIKLKTRVEARMALANLSATNEDNPIAIEDAENLIKQELHYRDKQLLRLKEEILDLEDFDESGVSLTEFSLEDFRADLLRYLETNRAALESAPLGLHALVPADTAAAILPGVIFCLRHQPLAESEVATSTTGAPAAINPLQPHYLVYIHADGNVRLTFAQPKQILEALRHLCADRKEAIHELCALFDRETNNGENMSAYNILLKSALASIANTFRQRTATNLATSRDFILPLQTEQPNTAHPDEFELITWVIIK
jgi:superfamily II DNA or RNA helicase